MSDYRFRCADCGKINQNHSTGHVPEIGAMVECISCGRISEVEYQNVILETKTTKKKVSPSKLDALQNLDGKEKKE